MPRAPGRCLCRVSNRRRQAETIALIVRGRSPRACNQWLDPSSEIEPVTDGADAARVSLGAGAAQQNRPLPSPNLRHRTEGEDTPPPCEETATADDDLVRVVNVPLVADVIQPADVRAIAREHPVASGGGEEAAEFRLCTVAPLAALAPATLLHGREE
jgi:hypothetical protein